MVAAAIEKLLVRVGVEHQNALKEKVVEGCRKHGPAFAKLVEAFIANPSSTSKKLLIVAAKERVMEKKFSAGRVLESMSSDDMDWIDLIADLPVGMKDLFEVARVEERAKDRLTKIWGSATEVQAKAKEQAKERAESLKELKSSGVSFVSSICAKARR